MSSAVLSLILGLCLVLSGSVHAQETPFLRNFPDIPTPPGMIQSADGIVFETFDGRFVQTQLTGVPTSNTVQFLRETLPSLGWKELPNNGHRSVPSLSDNQQTLNFHRNGEQLSFELVSVSTADDSPEHQIVLVTLSPLPSP